jgi:hypothetical protein
MVGVTKVTGIAFNESPLRHHRFVTPCKINHLYLVPNLALEPLATYRYQALLLYSIVYFGAKIFGVYLFVG